MEPLEVTPVATRVIPNYLLAYLNPIKTASNEATCTCSVIGSVPYARTPAAVRVVDYDVYGMAIIFIVARIGIRGNI
jgi:hypothetical protein